MIYCIAYNVYYVKQSPFVDSGGPAVGATKSTLKKQSKVPQPLGKSTALGTLFLNCRLLQF
jgi:hypothetical protein